MNDFPPTDTSTGEQDEDKAAGQLQATDARPRPVYDGTSESTRSLRDTSRRRRDAEVKLQQHLMAAKDHVPHHHELDDHADEDSGTSDVAPEDGAPETAVPNT